MGTTKKSIILQKIENIYILVEKVEVLNSFKRKNKGTKVSLFTAIKEIRIKLEELKNTI